MKEKHLLNVLNVIRLVILHHLSLTLEIRTSISKEKTKTNHAT